MNSLANLLKPFLLGFVLNFLKSKGPNQTFSFRIFRVLHTVQSLIFKVLCCSLSQTAHICYHKLFCLSRTFSIFSKIFSFKKVLKINAETIVSERRRRDLNPRAATNDLLPFQGSPFGQLGYFSKILLEKQFFF